MIKKAFTLIGFSVFSGLLTLVGYKAFIEKKPNVNTKQAPISNFKNVAYTPSPIYTAPENFNFIEASKKTIHSVVHVKNTAATPQLTPFEAFFYNQKQMPAQIGTGSGVIISADGYIITNNHVIDGAQSISITTNDNKTFEAELIGADEKTDIALLKIESDEDLPYTVFGDSDNAQIGEWVLAVGNPFNLTSTVTAGIISAKSRDLDKYGRSTQSFIQTDAAVNPGNSGGALVNIKGELIGINTAITSETGSYVGYSFAVPSNIAQKVIEDILEFGNVQTGILGVEIAPLNSETAKQLNVTETEGVYINKVFKNTGAKKAGVKDGDIIIKLDNVKISKFADLRGYLSSKRPGDIVNIIVKRNDKEKLIPVTLTKDESSATAEILNLKLKNIPDEIKDKYQLKNGVVITESKNLQLYRFYNLKQGYIITSINDTEINSVEDVLKLKRKHGKYFDEAITSLKYIAPSRGIEREIIFE